MANKMSRREARCALLEILFSTEYTPEKTSEELVKEWLSRNGGVSDDFVMEAVSGIKENLSDIDNLIETAAVGWSMNRISRVSRAILRGAVYEMLYCPSIPLLVSLDEAIELSKLYDDEKAFSFVNGVLNKVMESDRVKAVSRS